MRERALLVGLDLKSRSGRSGAVRDGYTPEEALAELAGLTRSAGAEVLDSVLQSRERAEAATLIGSGKVDELAARAQAEQADLIVFDRELSPTQQRNLEQAFDCKVIDRTQLILDIFARRARTREGQLQVELAQLNYLLPRLTGHGAQMSRLGGGIGTRGPGETKLETDRRRIFRRKRKLEDDLDAVRKGRRVQRRQRQAVPLATAALVGYTNAGKSTLFNRITGAEVAADARMFATLDPTVRAVVLPSRRRILLSDTVGFIRNLPVELVKAFRATLEEVTEASLILHVVDASSVHAAHQMSQVQGVLAEIGAERTPQLFVLNKVDLAPEAALARDPARVPVSARTGEGLEDLLAAVDRMLPLDPLARVRFRVPAGEGSVISLLHELGRVESERYEDAECVIEAEVPESLRARLAEYVK